MWIKLLRPHACFYPPRLESTGTIVSIGGSKGAALIAAGAAEPAATPLDIDDGGQTDSGEVVTNIQKVSNCALSELPKKERPPLSPEASALVAALGRRARRRRLYQQLYFAASPARARRLDLAVPFS